MRIRASQVVLLLFCIFLGMLGGLWWQAGHPMPGTLPFVRSTAPQPGTGPEPSSPPPAQSPAPAVPSTAPVVTPPAPPPPPAARLESTHVGQGTFTILHLTGLDSTEGVKVTGLADHGPWVRQDDGWAMLLSVRFDAKPGVVPLSVTWPGGGHWESQVTIDRYPFTEDRLVVTQEQADSWTDPQVEKDGELLNETRRHSSPKPLWQGRFIWPVQPDRITTEFGEIRYVNGQYTGQHTGTDIAAPTGTPVKATNSGKVVIASFMVLTGNTVVIDYGAGLFSLYGHLNSMAVKVGESVRRGDTIGALGSTGFSTGPHLHWTMTIGNTFINPRQLADHGLLAERLPGPQELE